MLTQLYGSSASLHCPRGRVRGAAEAQFLVHYCTEAVQIWREVGFLLHFQCQIVNETSRIPHFVHGNCLNKTKGHTRKRIVIAIVMPILSVTPAWLISEHDLKKKEEKSSGVILNPPRYMRCPWCMCNYSIITEIITVWARLITLLAKMVHF